MCDLYKKLPPHTQIDFHALQICDIPCDRVVANMSQWIHCKGNKSSCKITNLKWHPSHKRNMPKKIFVKCNILKIPLHQWSFWLRREDALSSHVDPQF